MKLALITLATAILVFSQRSGPQMLFPYPLDDTSAGIYNLNAAATWRAFGFIATGSRTLSTVEIYVSGATGSMTASEFSAALYSDNTGKPGTQIEEKTASAVPAAGWSTFTGFTSATTAGTAYWVVFRNTNSTPASNYVSFRLQGSNQSTFGLLNNTNSGTTGFGWMSATSTDSGATWTRGNVVWNAVLTWPDGLKEGFPIDSAGTQCQVYSTRECGTFILTPPYVLNINGVAMTMTKTGTPTGSLRFRVYEGSNTSGAVLVATTNSITPAGVSSTASYVGSMFTTPVMLRASTRYRIVASETTQSDSSSNRYNVTTFRILSSAASIFMPMMGSSPDSSLSTDGGSTWTNTSNEFVLFTFLLDPYRPFIFANGGVSITQ